MPEDEIVQYIIVNTDLKMGKGKLAAQASHGAVKGYYWGKEMYNKPYQDYADKWFHGSHTKIVLKSNYNDMIELMKDSEISSIFIAILDEGRTQIEKDSLTVIASIPLPKSNFPKEIRELKLL